MRWISRRSITGPSLRFNIDRTNVDMPRSSKINTSSKGEHTESVRVGMRISARLILKTAHSAKGLHIGIETALTDKRVSRPDEIGVLSNVRRSKEADVVHISFHTKTTPQVDVTINREAFNVSAAVIGYGKREACANLHRCQPRSRWDGLGMRRHRQTEHKNEQPNQMMWFQNYASKGRLGEKIRLEP